jgi:signal transduction histidine kinase
MTRFPAFLLSLLLLFIFTQAFSQNNDTTNWTTLHVVNGSSTCKLYNIKLFYSKGSDTSWVISLKDRYSEMLMPRDTSTLEIPGTEFAVRYYTFDCDCNGIILHGKIDEPFVLKKGEKNVIIVPGLLIPSKWWQSMWFILVTIFSLIVVLCLLIIKVNSNKKLKAQKKELQQKLILQKERLRISTEMHDDIGSGLLAVRLQAEILYKHFIGTGMEGRFDNMNVTIRDITAKVREVIWSLDGENDTLFNLIAFIQQQASRMYENSGLQLQFSTSDPFPDLIIPGENRRNVYLAVKEALHNIVKHANATITEISFSADQKTFYISIKDNGIGFTNASSSVESKGFRNMKQRVEKLNGTFAFSSSKSGTKINISIPLINLKA